MATNRFSSFSSSAEAGSSQRDDFAASSSNQTQRALRKTIQNEDIAKVEGKFEVDTPKLIQHISELLERREKGKLRHEQPSKPKRFFEWSSVPWFNKLKEILSLGTDIEKLAKDLLKPGLELVSGLKEIISGPVKTVLTDIGKASLATAGLLLVAYTLEGLDNLSSNQEECWLILEQMNFVATVVEKLKASPEVIQDLIERATILIAEGAIMCCSKMDSSPWKKFFFSQKIKQDLSDITKRLNVMYMKINIEIGFRVLTAIESKGKSPLSKKYPKHAVGIEEPIKEVLCLLEIESGDQNAITVILHGFGGMGKTTLADAVFSSVGGCGYSKVRLPVDINPPDDVIVKLQREILTDLMGPGQPIPEIRAYEDGRRELETVLQKVHGFIYIDNVLDPAALGKLLPEDLTEAKKVRILLTTRDKDVKITCPRPCTEPKIYTMKGIQHQEALIILKREIKEGITEVQLNNIIDTCGGIPLMLKVTAAMIGRAGEKGKAYATLMEEKQKAYARLIENKKWTDKAFDGMGYAFAYNALPRECKDPFLDICEYFNDKWKWDKVEDIVGQDELETLENRALITRTPDGFASVHDVILTLARQMSKEESKDKELRRKFNHASELKEFLEKGDTEGIRGIWLTERNDVPKEEDDDDERKVVVQASALDKFHKSLRFLQLGNSIKVEGNCKEIFKDLVFFGAKISQLPFDDVSQQLKQLRYLSCTARTLMPSPLSSKLRFMDFDGRMFREVPKATVYNDEVAPIQSASTSY